MPQVGQDIEMSDDGDLVLDASGDLALATPERTVIQDVEMRIRTKHLDFGPEPYLGANLDRFRGYKQSRNTGNLMKEAAYYSLIKDGRFARSQCFCEAVPWGKDKIALYAFIQDYIQGMAERSLNREGPLVVEFAISLDSVDEVITRITDTEE